MSLRKIRQEDNAAAAAIVRKVMTEFGAVGEGYSIEDPEVDFFFEHYAKERHAFFVIEIEGKLLGVGGIAPLRGADSSVCELQKMYFLEELRGQGWGNRMMDACLREARANGFQTMYLETLQSMDRANKLYKKYGFKPLEKAMGATGHGGCNAYYAVEL